MKDSDKESCQFLCMWTYHTTRDIQIWDITYLKSRGTNPDIFRGPLLRVKQTHSLPSPIQSQLSLSHLSQWSCPCNPFRFLQICHNKQHLMENKCYQSIKCISVVNTVIFLGSHPCETINKCHIYTISTIKCISNCFKVCYPCSY